MEKRNIQILFLLALCFVCCQKKVDRSLLIQVRDNLGKEVAGAVIEVDGSILGQADEKGVFEAPMQISLAKPLSIKVSKDSQDQYYADYLEHINLLEKTDKTVFVEAVLFGLPKDNLVAQNEPKPKAEPDFPKEGKKEEPVSKDKGNILKSEPVEDTTQEGDSEYEYEDESYEDEEEEDVELYAKNTKNAQNVHNVQNIQNEKKLPAKIKESKKLEEPKKIALNLNEPLKKEAAPLILKVVHGDNPLKKAEILLGDLSKKDLTHLCFTNNDGSCSLSPDSLTQPMHLVVQKKGYVTHKVVKKIEGEKTFLIPMQPGISIDIYALTRNYNFSKGVKGVNVFMESKQIGQTDDFGFFSYLYKGEEESLVEIRLENESYLPLKFKTDFVVMKGSSLVRLFLPKNPIPLQVVKADLQIAGHGTNSKVFSDLSKMEEKISSLADKYLFKAQSVKNYPYSQFKEKLEKAGLTEQDILKKGWSHNSLRDEFQVMLVPTLSSSQGGSLELSVVDSKGIVIAAASHSLKEEEGDSQLHLAMADVADKLLKQFPFEGAITALEGQDLRINIGSKSERGLAVGELVEIHGISLSQEGSKKSPKFIGTCKIKKVSDEVSHCSLTEKEPLSYVGIGDQVVLQRISRKKRDISDSLALNFFETSLNEKKPIAQASVYLNDEWLGASDEKGVLLIPSTKKLQGKNIKVMKQGFDSFVKVIDTVNSSVEINLVRKMVYIKIASNPEGADIFIEDHLVGKTPLKAPLEVKSGLVKLVVKGPKGYKEYKTILDIQEGASDLTGAKSIVLEHDFIAEAKELIARKKQTEALALLARVEKTHSDFYLARHLAGELYLKDLSKPELALKEFSQVVADPEVKNFRDKRYIGTYLDMGIAQYLVGKSLKKDHVKESYEEFLHAVKTLEEVTPYLHYLSQEEHKKAKEEVLYYKAQSFQEMWSLSMDSKDLKKASMAWNLLISEPHGAQDKNNPHIKNALVYIKQNQVSLGQNGKSHL